MSKINSFKRVTSQLSNDPAKISEDLSRLFNTLQSNVEKALVPVMQTPILDGRLVESVSITAGSTVAIEHKLGRKVRGYFIASNSTGALIYDYLNTGTYDNEKELYLHLTASGNCVLNLWIF